MNVLEALSQGEKIIKNACLIDAKVARIESKVLLKQTLGVSEVKLISEYERELSEIEEKTFLKLLDRRKKREPIAYITNEKEFYGNTFYVDENVLIPRPETEDLIEHAIKTLKGNASVLDVGFGSGVIAVTLKHLIPTLKVHAIDISKEALLIAKKNARSILGKENDITFELSDIRNFNCEKKFDLIISNPPYIPKDKIKDLSDEVLREPSIALDGGEKGLEIIAVLSDNISKWLRSEGYFYIEADDREVQYALELFDKNIYDVDIAFDLSGKKRFIKGKLN